MQYNLFHDETKSKRIEELPTDKLVISDYNPRKTRSEEYVDRLSQRIHNNGYEITRALWVYPVNEHYEVFAGGTRLKASKIAELETIPCVIHEGYSEEEIIKLADEDNENDEYHEPVPITDVWASYKALADQGWTQERIAKAKGVNRGQVSQRIKYSELPETIKDHFVKNDFLKEGHAAELVKLLNFNNLQPWLTREMAMKLIIDNVISGRVVRANDYEKEVNKFNTIIEMASEAIEVLPEDRLINNLLSGRAYTKYEVRKTIDNLKLEIAKEKREAAEAAKADADKADREAREAKHRAEIESISAGVLCKLGEHYLYCGDTSKPEFYKMLPDNIAFAFADPPYNAGVADWDNDFRWDHDWLIECSDVVAVTPGISSIFDFANITKMPYKWSMASWITNGMTRGDLGFGNWIYIALFSKLESIHKNAQDVIKVTINNSETEDDHHKGTKPLGLLTSLIDLFTNPGEYVLDPFAGSGSTLIACETKSRKCITGEIDIEYCKNIIYRWEEMTGQEAIIDVDTL